MAVDQSKIVDAVVGMNPHGNEEGIIDAFEVYLTNHYADYYNRVSYRFEKELAIADPSLSEMGQYLLIEAGHVCAFYTFGGIYRSDAWKGLIAPMCKTKEDEIKGVVATVNALGWGVWQVVSVNPEKMVLRVLNSYESTGYMKEFGKSKQGECYLVQGGAAGLMSMIYQGEIYNDPSIKAYKTKEVKCRSKGDKYCEFVVTREKQK